MIDSPALRIAAEPPFVCFRVVVGPGETNEIALGRELAKGKKNLDGTQDEIPFPFTVCTLKGHYTWQKPSDVPLHDLIAASGAYLIKYDVSS